MQTIKFLTAFAAVVSFYSVNAQADAWQPYVCEGNPARFFRSEEPVELTIQSKFPIKGSAPVDARVIYKDDEGKTRSLDIQLETRGKSRKFHCSFDPLRLIWKDRDARDESVFRGVRGKDMKLVVHCEYTSGTIVENPIPNEEVKQEYSLYKVVKALGLPAYNVRLAKIQYQDVKGNNVVEGMGFFIEPDANLERRCDLEHVKSSERNSLYATADHRILADYMVTVHTIDTWDYIVDIGHNSEGFKNTDSDVRLMMPYDFNDSGLIQSRGNYRRLRDTIDSRFEQLKQWPIQRDGGELRFTYDMKPTNAQRDAWFDALKDSARTTIANRDQAFDVIKALPILEENKEEIREQLDFMFDKMRQYWLD